MAHPTIDFVTIGMPGDCEFLDDGVGFPALLDDDEQHPDPIPTGRLQLTAEDEEGIVLATLLSKSERVLATATFSATVFADAVLAFCIVACGLAKKDT